LLLSHDKHHATECNKTSLANTQGILLQFFSKKTERFDNVFTSNGNPDSSVPTPAPTPTPQRSELATAPTALLLTASSLETVFTKQALNSLFFSVSTPFLKPPKHATAHDAALPKRLYRLFMNNPKRFCCTLSQNFQLVKEILPTQGQRLPPPKRF